MRSLYVVTAVRLGGPLPARLPMERPWGFVFLTRHVGRFRVFLRQLRPGTSCVPACVALWAVIAGLPRRAR